MANQSTQTITMTQPQQLMPSLAALKISHANAQPYPSNNATTTHVVNPSPDSHMVDCSDPILEEDEENETSSEPVEAITPTSDHHPHDFDHHVGSLGGNNNGIPAVVTPMKPLIGTVPATPPPSTSRPATSTQNHNGPQPSLPIQNSESPPKKSAAKTLRSFFRRTHSQNFATEMRTGPCATNGGQGTYTPTRKPSFTLSSRNSPAASQSNSPPSPGSPTSTLESDGHWSIPPPLDPLNQKQARSSTGLNIKDKSRIMFSTTNKPQRPGARKRSTSMTGLPFFEPDNSISMPAATGVGLKARRMSTSLPDDFNVDTVELNKEFTSTSMLPGKRGKVIGKGATATVKLMVRKGAPADEVYAVKEFRKKGQHEDEAEYVKKVKSEYSIAKSLHHPNIVTSVRLCTHSGRWNHVMEFCPQGELFSLVEKRYFKLEDRLCLFKQLLRGVAHLHDHGIAHRDIKLENLLMTNEGHLKITDFGVSEVFCGEHPGVRAAKGECGQNMKESRRCSPGICGSLPYIAPEVLEKKGKRSSRLSGVIKLTSATGDYDPRPLDVWSCAIVFLTMTFGGSPWPAAERSHSFYQKYAAGWDAWLAKHPDGVITDDPDEGMPKCGPIFAHLDTPAIKRLMLKMLHPIPEKRISIQDALGDRWVKTIDCCSLEDYTSKDSTIDVAGSKSCKLASKLGVKKMHNHLPPAKQRMPQHRFDMGHGWS